MYVSVVVSRSVDLLANVCMCVGGFGCLYNIECVLVDIVLHRLCIVILVDMYVCIYEACRYLCKSFVVSGYVRECVCDVMVVNGNIALLCMNIMVDMRG